MTAQRDDMTGSGAADPAPGQETPPEPIEGQIVPPPRVSSEPDRPAGDPELSEDPGLTVARDPADDRGPAEDRKTTDDREPANDGETDDGETVTDREPEDAPPLVTDTDAEPADAEPLLTGHEPADAPPLVTAPEPATDTPDTIPAAALAQQQWPAIQSLFVDDPRGAVERAAAAATEVAASLVATLEREQAELRASWQPEADTEQLRTALQRYRAFCGRLEGLA
jgi:hypothetical protein